VSIACAQASDGGKAYDWIFSAVVSGGLLQGQRGDPWGTNSTTINGRIRPDGSALLKVYGKTGDSEYSVDRVKPGYPYHFTVTAHFDERAGAGKRNELRPCDATFTKN
jgi:hypothetical protein